MSNIDNIINKLKAEADEAISKIQVESTTKLNAMKDELIGSANAEKEDIIEDAKKEAERIFERINSNAELKLRDQKLGEQQKLIDRVFDLALKKINSRTDQEYIADMKKIMANISGDDITLVVPEKRLSAVESANLGYSIAKDEYVENGFLVKSGRMVYNYKFDDLLSVNREEIEPELARKLFKN